MAVCTLLQQISRVEVEELCVVGSDACQACCLSVPPTSEKINPVIASFLYRIGAAVLEAEGLPRCSVAEAVELKATALASLAWAPAGSPTPHRISAATPQKYKGTGRTYACDVVLCCTDSSPRTERALRSVLDQASAMTLVHLVDNGGGGRMLAERYASSGSVWVHHNPRPKSPLAAAHDLIDRLGAQYIALQDPRTVSRPDRICFAVGVLEEQGGEIFGSALQTPSEIVRPSEPGAAFDRYLPAETLVIRRGSFVDLGGIAEREGDEDVELVYRALREERKVLLSNEVTVEAQDTYRLAPLGAPPVYEPHHGVLRHHARGFPHQPVACDVVLPFWGQLEHVRAALESMLEQRGAEAVIHLVDDASPQPTQDFLRYWSTHRQIRTYRNECNLSQFTSFNNVSPFFETGLVAVQDGDDVSLPDRLNVAGNMLRLASADIFGSSVVICDADEPMVTDGFDRLPPDVPIRRRQNIGISAWPTPEVYWFLFNPSMVLRTDAFRQLGGFGDFGGNVRNRCGHDIEFCLRAWHRGKRFVLSRQPTVLYRQHPDQTTRNPFTGFGTDAERWTSQEARRRGGIYRRTRFDPAAFGALGKYHHLTQRLKP